MTMQGQYDIVDEYSKNFFRSEKFDMFACIASKDEFAKFFETVLRLQSMLSVEQFQNINLFFSTKIIWPKLATSSFLGMYDDVIDVGEHQLQREDMYDHTAVLYLAFAYLTKGLVNKFKKLMQNDLFNPLFLPKYSTAIHIAYNRAVISAFKKICDDALFKYNHIFEYDMKQQQFEIINNSKDILTFLQRLITHFSMKRYHETFSLLNKFILFFEQDFILTTRKCNANLKLLLELVVCRCLIEANHIEQALHRAFETLELCYQLNIPWQCLYFDLITGCYSKLGHIKQAKHYNKILQNCPK